VKLYKHQLKTVKFTTTHSRVFDTSDAGTGKTAAHIVAFAKRRRTGDGCMLVVCPRSIMFNVWVNDFKTFAPDMVVSVAPASKRAEGFVKPADVYITNHDAAVWLAKLPVKFWKKFDTLALDESTAYKHHTAARSEAIQTISNQFKYRVCMTATPNSNTILDIWHQAFLLDNGKRLGASYYSFRNTVCSPTQVTKDPRAIQWADRDGAEEAVFGLLADITIRHELDKCVDIPPRHEYTINFTLTSKARSMYEQMAQNQLIPMLNALRLQRSKKQVTKTSLVTAINASAVYTKLCQIASGAVYSSPDVYTLIDTSRYELIADLIEARPISLVFYLWQHQHDQLVIELKKRGIQIGLYDSKLSDRARRQVVDDYQLGKFKTLLAHPQSASHGLTLTTGTSTIWASPTSNLEWFKQGSLRQRRIGQTKKTETVIVTAQDTVETDVYEKLLSKNARMTNLLDMFASMT